MTPAVASERSIFSKNHDCNSYSYRVFRVAVNTYAISGCRCTRWQKTIYEQTHTHTRDSHSDDNNKDYSKRCSSIGIIIDIIPCNGIGNAARACIRECV